MFIKRKHTSKPSYPVGIDWSNSLAKGLAIASFPRKGYEIDVVNKGYSLQTAPTTSQIVTAQGEGLYKTSSADQGWDFLNPSLGSSNRTILMGIRRTAARSGVSLSSSGTNATSERFTFRYQTSALRIEIEGSGYSSSLTPTLDEYSVVGINLDGTTLGDCTLFLNGSEESATGTATISTTGTAYS